jgi:predicted RNA-binding protein associated with RNAse of E/G family
LGVGEVTACEDRTVTLRREMTGGGRYDGLGVGCEAGDVAVTRLTEGKWWYPTVYRDADGTVKGTYLNVCTPLELFPDGATYVDLEVDVVKYADGTVERLDEQELAATVEAGHVSDELAEKARAVAASIEQGLSQ